MSDKRKESGDAQPGFFSRQWAKMERIYREQEETGSGEPAAKPADKPADKPAPIEPRSAGGAAPGSGGGSGSGPDGGSGPSVGGGAAPEAGTPAGE